MNSRKSAGRHGLKLDEEKATTRFHQDGGGKPETGCCHQGTSRSAGTAGESLIFNAPFIDSKRDFSIFKPFYEVGIRTARIVTAEPNAAPFLDYGESIKIYNESNMVFGAGMNEVIVRSFLYRSLYVLQGNADVAIFEDLRFVHSIVGHEHGMLTDLPQAMRKVDNGPAPISAETFTSVGIAIDHAKVCLRIAAQENEAVSAHAEPSMT